MALAGCVQVFEERQKDAIGTKTDIKAETGDTYKVGALLPLSGDGATYGIPVQRVAKHAVETVNKAGGVKGKKLEFVFEDGGCNPDTANRAIQKLVSIDKVKVVYGGFCSSETLAAAPVVEQNKVVLLSPGSSSPDITTAGDYVFRNYPSDSTQGKVLAEYAASKGFKKVGVIAEQQPYTLGIQKVFEAEFKKTGGEVLVETYLSDASDFRTQILKLKAEKVDAYFVDPQTPPKGELLFKQMEEAGVKGPFIANDVVLGFTDLITKYKSLLEGAVGAEATYDRQNADMLALQKWYKEEYKEELPYLTYMATSYDAVMLLKEAIESAGYDADGIKKHLYGIKDRKGLSGSLTIDANGDPMSGHILRMVKAGTVEDYKK